MTAATKLPLITLYEDNGGGLHLLADYNDYPEWDRAGLTIYYHVETISHEPTPAEDALALQAVTFNPVGIEFETLPEDSILDHPETRRIAIFVDGHWQRTDEPIGNNGRWYLGISRDDE